MRCSLLFATGAVLVSLPAGALAAGPPADHPTGKNTPGAASRPSAVPAPALSGQTSPVASAAAPSVTGSAGTDPAAAATPVPGPAASASTKAEAYGRYCKGVSKKRVDGAKGTPFSLCVTAMAKLATEQTASPRAACKGLTKKRVAGQKRTPFSLCVSGAAKLQKDQAVTAPEPSGTAVEETTETPAV